jgi:hypothetical protein
MTGSDAADIDIQAILDAVAEASAATMGLRDASASTGAAFRRFDVERAGEELVALAQNLGSLLALTEAIASALSGLHGMSGPGLPQHSTALFGAPLERLLAARAAGDCIQLADLLEHDVPAVLEQWSQWFMSCQSRLASVTPA